MHYQEYLLRTTMQKYWYDTIYHIRMLIISKVNEIDDVDDILERLIINQEEIGAAIKFYYDKEIVTGFIKLLKDHIRITQDVIINTVDKDTEQLSEDKINLYKNTDDISSFLFEVNAHINNKLMKNLLIDYIEATEKMLNYRINSNYVYEFMMFDESLQYALTISDMISNSIIEEFPDKFSSNRLDALM